MSTLRELLHDYLAMRRALGFKLRTEGIALLSFVTFILKRVVGARRGPFPARVLAPAAAKSRLCRSR